MLETKVSLAALKTCLLGAMFVLLQAMPCRGTERDAYDDELIRTLRAISYEAADLFEQADAAREDGDWLRAEELYGDVSRLAPEFYHATRRRCWAVSAQGRRQEALDLCREAVAVNDDPVNLVALARVLLDDEGETLPSGQERAEGLALARAAFDRAPRDASVVPSVAISGLVGNDQTLLREALGVLLEIQPDDLSTAYLELRAALLEQRYADARSSLQRAQTLGLSAEGADAWNEEIKYARAESAVALEFSGPSGKLIEGLAWYLVFLLSVTFHEAAHAYSAKRGGDLTAYHGGQVSLDPVPHIRREPFGMVILPLISLVAFGWPFGFASTPYDPHWAESHPRRAAWMALAGPGANLALVLGAAGLIRAGMLFGVFVEPMHLNLRSVTVAPESWQGVAYLLSLIFSLNLILVVLNLIPLPPLDGSGALPLIFGETASRKLRGLVAHPMVGWVGLLLAWKMFDPLFDRVFVAVIQLLYPGTYYS